MAALLPQPPERSWPIDNVGSLDAPLTDSRDFFFDELEHLEAKAAQCCEGGGWVLVRPVNGLCNRLRAIVSGLLLAEDLGRTLILDWQTSDACIQISVYGYLSCFLELYWIPIGALIIYTGGWGVSLVTCPGVSRRVPLLVGA